MRYIIFSRSFTNKNYLTNYFQELAEFRQQLNLPLAGSESDRATVAKLEIGDRGFLGVSSGSNPSPLFVRQSDHLYQRAIALSS